MTTTIPVTVTQAEPENLWPAAPLPVSANGITFSDAGSGRIHVTGTSTGYATLSVNTSLPGAGTYTTTGGQGFNGSVLYMQVKAAGATVLNPSTTSVTLTAAQTGSVQCQIVVAPGQTVDTTVTPALTKTA
ncbi:hypothetical protein [Bifidobacterium vansinderenii]|uniref:hypothetical protein n=1 Tax=Bifidobacterium vansinderenii TaxID=1984871 RepID=UPI001178456D|nr:hypothetical protein [Bifidobacterium vansinderenii]